MKPVSWLQYCEGVTFLQLDEFLQPKVLSYILYTNTLPKISKQPLNKVSINLYLSPPLPADEVGVGVYWFHPQRLCGHDFDYACSEKY